MATLRTDDDVMHPAEGVLSEIGDIISRELSAAGVSESAALANRCARRLATSFGGQILYLPKGAAGERLVRNCEIRRLHDGTRHGPNGVTALASRYGLSEVHIYRVLNATRPCHTRRPA